MFPLGQFLFEDIHVSSYMTDASHRQSTLPIVRCNNVSRSCWLILFHVEMGHKRNPARTRPTQAPQGTKHFWQPPPLLLPFSRSSLLLPPQTRDMSRHRFHRRARTHRRHLLWRPPGRHWRRQRLRHRSLLASGNRADNSPGRPSRHAIRPAPARLEPRQGQRAGDEPAVAQDRDASDGGRVSGPDAGPPAHRLGGDADGEESARAEWDRADE